MAPINSQNQGISSCMKLEDPDWSYQYAILENRSVFFFSVSHFIKINHALLSLTISTFYRKRCNMEMKIQHSFISLIEFQCQERTENRKDPKEKTNALLNTSDGAVFAMGLMYARLWTDCQQHGVLSWSTSLGTLNQTRFSGLW